jgi:hypothetical protein
MLSEFTSAEKVLYTATVKFAMETLKLSADQAHQRGMDKVLQKRKLVKKMSHFKY